MIAFFGQGQGVYDTGVLRLKAGFFALAGLGLQALVGCSPNEPFDPGSLGNHRPTIGMSVAPPDTGSFPATSYYNRTFYWHGTDQDGWVTGYDISIRLDRNTVAPWVATTRTDTTMNFDTDDQGEAEATFYIVARDNRDALSDTLVQLFPLKNFPPEIYFEADFDPLSNMQREINGSAVGDTVYWNWGDSNFKLTASDLDGPLTMDRSYRYTFADSEPTETYWEDDPQADPENTWVKAMFTNAWDREAFFFAFEINARNLAVGSRTLTVSISDEGGSDTRFVYQWEVRAPRSNILYIKDNSSSIGRQCYGEFMDARFGVGNWDTYDFWMGYPDRHTTLTSVMRRYEAVLWSDGGSTSDIMAKASETNGALQAYVVGGSTAAPGKFVLVSGVMAGNSSRLGAYFRQVVMKVKSSVSPASGLTMQAGTQALGEVAGPLPMTSEASSAKGIGLQPEDGGDILYRMEECIGCYTQRPPADPVVGIRSPLRSVDPEAHTIAISTQLEFFNRAEVLAALTYLFDVEMGVPSP